MAKRKKKRTSIRTAAGTAQDSYRARLEALRDDPLRVLPASPFGEHKALRRIRTGLEKIAAGKVGLLARRDKGIVGAVANTLPLLEQDSYPRLADHKVGGRRRFYIMRGQVQRACMLAVQNHDDPQTLMMGYRPLAKAAGLHFFADAGVTCSGERPVPPDTWWQFVGDKMNITWHEEEFRSCPHTEADLVYIEFANGPAAAVCAHCTKGGRQLHGVMKAYYVGPRERQPFQVHLLRGGIHGEAIEIDRDLLAKYRGGITDEATLVQETLAGWRQEQGGSANFILGGQDFGNNHEAFLDALQVEAWMRPAVAAMTARGHQGPPATLAQVLSKHDDRLLRGVEALLTDKPGAFIREHPGLAPHAMLAEAHRESVRRARVADLPTVRRLGPVGSWADHWARTVRKHDAPAGVQLIRRAVADHRIPNGHLYGFLQVLGSDLSLEAAFSADEKAQGMALAQSIEPILETSGPAYADALRDYLRQSGIGVDA